MSSVLLCVRRQEVIYCKYPSNIFYYLGEFVLNQFYNNLTVDCPPSSHVESNDLYVHHQIELQNLSQILSHLGGTSTLITILSTIFNVRKVWRLSISFFPPIDMEIVTNSINHSGLSTYCLSSQFQSYKYNFRQVRSNVPSRRQL